MSRLREASPDRPALVAEALAYADALHDLARYLAREPTEAEDLVQETYVRAFAALGQLEAGSNLKAWLFRILRNAFVSQYRRQRGSPVVGTLDTVDPRMPDAPAAEWLRDDLELDRLRKVVAGEIEQALLTLTEEGRTVILLDLEGLSEREIADVMGCAVGTVKSRLSRARSALRQRLQDYAH
jgi:RNA polymerase sigma-70 factor, ECF subfamily